MSLLSLNFLQTSLDKGTIKRLLTSVWRVYGLNVSVDTFDELKEIGFEYSTYVGFSMSLGDLMIPPQKKWMMRAVKMQDELCEHRTELGLVTPIEQFQRIMDLWHLTSEALRGSIIENFAKTNTRNPVYTMAQSGARGSMAQVRQLVGMRGLMANPKGEVVEYPIRANFREGLTLAEFAISGYGGRKGLVDTAVRTADAGYLTRRLVDVAHVVIVRQVDCGTQWSIPLRTLMSQDGDPLISIANRAVGRVVASMPIQPSLFEKIHCYPNQTISRDLVKVLNQLKVTTLPVRSPLTCGMWSPFQEIKATKSQLQSICQLCYGWDYSEERIVDLNQAVGIIAAQSIGEPGTQLTMRTFHTGGVFEGTATKRIRSAHTGTIVFDVPVQGSVIRTSYGNHAFLTYSPTYLRIQKEDGLPDEVFLIPSRSILYHRPGEKIHAKQPIFEPNYRPGPQSRGRVMMSEQLFHSEVSGEVWWPKSRPLRKVALEKPWSSLFRHYESSEIAEVGDILQHQLLGTTTSQFHSNNRDKSNLVDSDWLELKSYSSQSQLNTKTNKRIQLVLPQTKGSSFLSLQGLTNPLEVYRPTLRPQLTAFSHTLEKYKTFIEPVLTRDFYSSPTTNNPQPRLRAYKSFLEDLHIKTYQHNVQHDLLTNSFYQHSSPERGHLTGSVSPLEPVWVLEGLLNKINAQTFHQTSNVTQVSEASPDGLAWGFFINQNQTYLLDSIKTESQALTVADVSIQNQTSYFLQKKVNTSTSNMLLEGTDEINFCKIKGKVLLLAKLSFDWGKYWTSESSLRQPNLTTNPNWCVQSLQAFSSLSSLDDFKFSFNFETSKLINQKTELVLLSHYYRSLLSKYQRDSSIQLQQKRNFLINVELSKLSLQTLNESERLLVHPNSFLDRFDFLRFDYSMFYLKNKAVRTKASNQQILTFQNNEVVYPLNSPQSLQTQPSIPHSTFLHFLLQSNYQSTRRVVRPQHNVVVLSGQNPGVANNRILPNWFVRATTTPVLRKTQAQWGPSEFWFGRNLALSVPKINTICKSFNWVRQNKKGYFKNQLRGRTWQLKTKRGRLKSLFMRLGRKNVNTCLVSYLKTNNSKTKLLRRFLTPLLANQKVDTKSKKKLADLVTEIWSDFVTATKSNDFVLPSDLFVNFLVEQLEQNIQLYQQRIVLSPTLTEQEKQNYLIKLKNYYQNANATTALLRNLFATRKKDYWPHIQYLYGYNGVSKWRNGAVSPTSKPNTSVALDTTFTQIELQKVMQNAVKSYRRLQDIVPTVPNVLFQNSACQFYPLSPLGSNFVKLNHSQKVGRSGLCCFKFGCGQTTFSDLTDENKSIEWSLLAHYPRLSFLPKTNQLLYTASGITLPLHQSLGFGLNSLDNGIDEYGQRYVFYTPKAKTDLQTNQKIRRPHELKLQFLTTCNLCWLTPANQFSFSDPAFAQTIPTLGSIFEKQQPISSEKSLPVSGQLIQITGQKITVRPVAGYPVSRSRALFYLHHKTFIREGDPVYSYSYQRQRTGDIVQGIPVIESLFEGRVKRKGSYVIDNLRVPARDESVWLGVSRGGGGGRARIFESTLAGLLGVRLALVNRIQVTYLQQGVDFADKHVEVIVRRFTSQVHFKTGGGSRHLPTERVHELAAHTSTWLTSSTYSHRLKLCLAPTPKYLPSVTGLTKTALFAQSFLGSASFQESSKTFIRVGVKGAQNFLGGLKDQVITGRTLHFSSPMQELDSNTLFIISCQTKPKIRPVIPKLPYLLVPVLRTLPLRSNYCMHFSQSPLIVPPVNFVLTTHPKNWILMLLNSEQSNITTKISTTSPICFPLLVRFSNMFGEGKGIAAAITPNKLRLSQTFAFTPKTVYNKTKVLQKNQLMNSGSSSFYKGIGFVSFLHR